MPQYSVNNLTVDSVIGYIKNKEIAIPEIQRPFVWKSDQIRDFIDSLYNGYPHELANMDVNNYQDFLATRRKLMAKKVREYFESL